MLINTKEIGERIKKCRNDLGYTQGEFSEMLSISRSYLARVEVGVYAPSLELITEISAITGYSLDYHILGFDINSKSLNEKVLYAISLMNEVLEALHQQN